MISGGTAKFYNKDAFLSWYAALMVGDDLTAFCDRISKTQPSGKRTDVERCRDELYRLRGGHFIPYSKDDIERWNTQRDQALVIIREFLYTSETFLVPIRVGEWHEGNFAYLYLGNPAKGIIVPDPEKYLEYIPDKDYSNCTPAQVRASLMLPEDAAHMEIIPAKANLMTSNQVRSKVEEEKEKLRKAEADLDDLRNYRSAGLVELKAEVDRLKAKMEAKKETLMAEMREKMAELKATMESLENQIWLLDSQIYNILCFAGEAVKIAHIKKGTNAPDDSPIVIYQKLHFLADDLGRLASIYEIQFEELSMFEEFLSNSPIAIDTFLPAPRCISLVRLSRDCKEIGRDNRFPYQNMLTKYQYYHGKTIGILIRNGENVYVAWCDEDRVHIEDDLIVSIQTETQPVENTGYRSEFDIEDEERTRKAQQKKIVDGLISRSFVYNILQGAVERTPSILPLPDGVKLNQQSPYVIYSMADGWLTDNRFGSFTEIMDKHRERICKGDMILTMQHLIPERSCHRSWAPQPWENPRGRGQMNRTHDCSTEDCTLYSVNLVEYDPPVSCIRYRYPDPLDKTNWLYATCTVEPRDVHLSDNCEVLEEFERIDRHVFVSLKKMDSWDSEARANFEIYPDEFMPLSMSSVELEWAITNKSLGNWRLNGTEINYAYVIRYLKTALDYVRKREAHDKELLDAVDSRVCQTPEWQLALSEWKLEKHVREITPYQAKRFAKSILAKAEV